MTGLIWLAPLLIAALSIAGISTLREGYQDVARLEEQNRIARERNTK